MSITDFNGEIKKDVIRSLKDSGINKCIQDRKILRSLFKKNQRSKSE